ncbi:MarR family winged helix-turn-helix transcriptional regulator [Pelagibacterium sp. H642]|uniref:MarR family winged helix-turn-helix transcriptional regulator n=1 Tax=Pelagibacterium sp. H642 TaxID=1881069 RepID=UPI0028155403|nr:MarR family winged helix-turn-helix transcriptional regulator [Pelagibacterium sp. H642]WMT91694.1 MarR family winged helix-turn-helix transcriptional regulator [Pelagibacterium sp. H642]
MSASVAADAEDTLLRTEATTEIVGYRLRRAQLSVFQRFIAAFEQLNLRPAEYSVLALIADNPGRKQTEIAEILGIKRANFVALINGLDSRGLTERRVARGDRRANALYLTEEGERFLERARAVQAEFEADCVERLGGAEARDAFVRMLDRLC